MSGVHTSDEQGTKRASTVAADEVRAAVDALNDALAKAATAGVRVDIVQLERKHFGNPLAYACLCAECWETV